jgi:hypothetical protein
MHEISSTPPMDQLKKLYLKRISHNDKQLNSKSKSKAVTLNAMMAHILDLGTRWG